MEYNYYSLDECRTRDKVIERLEKLMLALKNYI